MKTRHTLTCTVVAVSLLTSSATAGVYKAITIDGSFGDWAGIAPAWSATEPGSTTSLAYKDIYVANDADYLYIRFTLFSPGDPFTSHENIFIDANADMGSGYAAGGGRVGSEMLVQSGSGYQEKNGGFNEGGIEGLSWASAPAAPSTDFEVRISRKATFTSDGTPVFGGDSIAFILEAEDASWNPVEFAPAEPGGLAYTFESAAPPLTQNTPLVELASSSWQVNASGADLSNSWLEASYDDTQAGWTSGQGLFGFTTNPSAYPSIQTPLASGHNTYYFRVPFTWSFDASNVVFVVTNYLSDGAVFYVNGAEVKRIRMPAGQVTYSTNATGTAVPVGTPDVFAIPAGPLVAGQNLLEVETHQAPASEQDMVFGASLLAATQYAVWFPEAAEPADRSVVAGNPTLFAAPVLGSGPLTYQWFKNNSPLENETNATLSLARALPIDAGEYLLEVSNPLSTNRTRAAKLEVTGTPVTLTDPSQPADQTIQEGNPVTFTVAGSGSAPLQYQWYKGDAAIADATNESYTISDARTNDGGSYHVVVSNPISSTNSRTALLIVTADKVPPAITAVEGSPNRIVVSFSEPVEPASATNTANYTLAQGATVVSAILNPADPAQVFLGTSGQALGVSYVLAVNAVRDRFGNAIASSSQRSFVSTIVIDGEFEDWQGLDPLYSGPAGDPSATDFKDIFAFSDANYLYLRITTWEPTVLQSWVNNFFFDTDNDPTTGYIAWGGAEMLVQGGAGYQEKNGGFNEGPINGLDWLCLPADTGTNFELRISRAATYDSDKLPVFATNTINFAFDAENTSYDTVNRAPDVGTFSFTMVEAAVAPPGPVQISYSPTSGVTVQWQGTGTLQSTTNLSSQAWTDLPSASSPYSVAPPVSQQFFRLVR